MSEKMGPPRIWRNRGPYLRLEGDFDPNDNTVAFPSGPNRPRHLLNGHQEEPLEEILSLPEMTADEVTSTGENGKNGSGETMVKEKSAVVYNSKD